MKSKGETLAIILRNYRDCYLFLHNTKDKLIVDKILKEGFIFESQLPRSTDRVSAIEPVEISYFLLQRKDYGSFTVVIAIPKSVYEAYATVSNQNDVGIEEIMTITEPYYGDNDELIYTLSPKHVLGFFNINTSEFFYNSGWDPTFNNCLVIPPGLIQKNGEGKS
jgi:hypothetical protein